MKKSISSQKEKKHTGFIDRFLSAVSDHPEAIAIEYEDEPQKNFTYAGLLEKMERFKGFFEKKEVSKNEIVALILPAGDDFISIFYGLVSAGGVALPLNSGLTLFEMKNILTDAQPAGVVCTGKILAAYRKLFEQIPGIRFIAVIDTAAEQAGDSIAIESVQGFNGVRSPLCPPPGNPVSTCHYTYRGCGYPLGVTHRYQDYTLCVNGMENRYPLRPDDAFLIGLPIYPIYGISILVIFPLSLGCRLVIAKNFMDQNFVDALERHRVMFTCLVPMILPKLASELKSRAGPGNINMHPHIVIGSSATLLPKKLHEEIAELSGLEIIQGYGLTEALSVSATFRKIPEERGTLGAPIHEDIVVKLIDYQGHEVAPGTLGQILVGGPTVCEGFLNKPEENKRFFKNGFFHTGDLGYVDGNGFLNFEGRALPIAKVAAQMVDLVEIESVMLMHPDVIKAKAVEKKAPVGRNYVSLTVVARNKSGLDEKKLQRFCSAWLSPYKVPAQITVITKDTLS
ncbi:MAG: acyl--CoA ligase [Desulfobacteraceae bacterium]|nr:acyl--CoA ligase [Desulfobacteraceae bacterium]